MSLIFLPAVREKYITKYNMLQNVSYKNKKLGLFKSTTSSINNMYMFGTRSYAIIILFIKLKNILYRLSTSYPLVAFVMEIFEVPHCLLDTQLFIKLLDLKLKIISNFHLITPCALTSLTCLSSASDIFI